MIITNKTYDVLYLKNNINEIPESTGVYIYYDEQHGGAYVGQTTNLRNRFLQHLSKSNAYDKRFASFLQKNPENFSYYLVELDVNKNILRSLEAKYIKKLNSINAGYNIKKEYDNGYHNTFLNKAENNLAVLEKEQKHLNKKLKDALLLQKKHLQKSEKLQKEIDQVNNLLSIERNKNNKLEEKILTLSIDHQKEQSEMIDKYNELVKKYNLLVSEKIK